MTRKSRILVAGLRIVVAVAILSGSNLAASPHNATAKPLRILTCSANGNLAEQSLSTGWTGTGAVYWSVVDRCPEGLSFERNETTTWLDKASWWYYSNTDIASIELRLGGANYAADDVRYTIRSCGYAGCADVAELPRRRPDEPPAKLMYSLNNSSRVGIVATCTEIDCRPSAPVLIGDIVLTLSDKSTPGWGLFERTANDVVKAIDGGWKTPNGSVFGISALDSQAGIASARVSIDGRAQPGATFECGIDMLAEFTPGSLCPKQVPLIDDIRATTGGSDGLHTLRVESVDLAGNVSPVKDAVIGFDSSPPPKPSAVTLLGTATGGWSKHSKIGASWRNDGEDQESQIQSGIAKSWIDIDPLSGQAEDPSPTANLDRTSRTVAMPGEGRWRFSLWLEDAAGNLGEHHEMAIGRDTDAPPAPQLDENSWVNASDLEAGYRQSWKPAPGSAGNESGVCGYAVEINSTFNSDPIPEINVGVDDPSFRIPPDTPPGTNFVHVRSISCAGIASSTATSTIQIDSQAPSIELSPRSTGGWQQKDTFIRLRAQDAASGVERIEYRLDSQEFLSSKSSDVSLGLNDGDHWLSYRSIDNAGNSSATESSHIRIDTAPPTAYFLPSDPDRPTAIRAIVGDSTSGVASGWMEIRSLTRGDEWRPVPTITSPRGLGESEELLTILDDSTMPDGSYEIRIRASDRAGNAIATEPGISATQRRVIILPLRSKPTIKSGLTATRTICQRTRRVRCKKNRVLDHNGTQPRNVVRYRQPVHLTGDLHDAEGRPLNGKTISIFGSVSDGPTFLVGQCTTERDGSFNYRLPTGPSRKLIARYDGDHRTLPAQSQSTLGVQATTTLRVGPKRVAWGTSVVFSGRISSGGHAVPVGGKDISIQFLNGAPQMTGVLTKSDVNGRFRQTYTFSRAVDKPVRYRFRAAIISSPAWPFLTGYSRPVTVTVTPK